MIFIAWQMLTGYGAKYDGLVPAIADSRASAESLFQDWNWQ